MTGFSSSRRVARAVRRAGAACCLTVLAWPVAGTTVQRQGKNLRDAPTTFVRVANAPRTEFHRVAAQGEPLTCAAQRANQGQGACRHGIDRLR